MRAVFLNLIGFMLLSPWIVAATGADFSRWYPYPQASQLAQQEGRVLMVYFWRHGCPYCDQMNTFVLSNEAVSQLLEQCFVVASVDSESPEGSALARQTRALGTPIFVFYVYQGDTWKELGRLFGSRPSAQFLGELKQVSARSGGKGCG